MQSLKIALVQFDIIWENSPANLDKLTELIHNSPGADIYILPEMFNTGFSMQPAEIAEADNGPATEWMLNISKTMNVMICGSIATVEKGKYYNRLKVMASGKAIGQYDKRNLFTLAGEEKKYTPGNNRLIIEYKGWKIMPLVCYDLRFPLWCHNVNQADLMIFVANWPDARIAAWRKLLPARAIENQCYVAAVNRCGTDGNGYAHQGSSMLIDPAGEILSEIKGCEAIEIITITPDKINESRKMIGSLKESLN